MTIRFALIDLLLDKSRPRCHAVLTPVIPLPIIHTSDDSVRAPVLPTSAKGLLSEVNQKDRVGLGTGKVGKREANVCCIESSDDLDISGDKKKRSSRKRNPRIWNER